MKLYRVNVVRKREYKAKTHWVRRLLVMATSPEDAKTKVMKNEAPELVHEVLIRQVDDDDFVFSTGGFSFTPAELEKHRKVFTD